MNIECVSKIYTCYISYWPIPYYSYYIEHFETMGGGMTLDIFLFMPRHGPWESARTFRLDWCLQLQYSLTSCCQTQMSESNPFLRAVANLRNLRMIYWDLSCMVSLGQNVLKSTKKLASILSRCWKRRPASCSLHFDISAMLHGIGPWVV